MLLQVWQLLVRLLLLNNMLILVETMITMLMLIYTLNVRNIILKSTLKMYTFQKKEQHDQKEIFIIFLFLVQTDQLDQLDRQVLRDLMALQDQKELMAK